MRPSPTDPTTFVLTPPRALDAVTLFSASAAERLPRSMDVAVSVDGTTFETVARRRRRGEREDLRWVNGHPQYVLDHDLIAIPLGGQVVAAVRIVPVLSSDPWTLSEVLLHSAAPAAARAGWDEWLDPHLSWKERGRALEAQPLRDREDWYYRWMLAARAAEGRPPRCVRGLDFLRVALRAVLRRRGPVPAARRAASSG